MTINEQIIKGFDDLAQKFGVVIDWGQQNIMPYIQELCQKYIGWEIKTSIVWMCIGVLFAIAGIPLLKSGIKWHNEHAKDYDYLGIGTFFFIGSAVILWCSAFAIIIAQVFDIVRCCTFPELQIINFIKSLCS